MLPLPVSARSAPEEDVSAVADGSASPLAEPSAAVCAWWWRTVDRSAPAAIRASSGTEAAGAGAVVATAGVPVPAGAEVAGAAGAPGAFPVSAPKTTSEQE